MKRRLLWLSAVALLVPVVLACYVVWYTYFVVHPYERVVRGASEAQVLASMGLRLGMEIPGWPPDNIEEMAKKLEQEF